MQSTGIAAAEIASYETWASHSDLHPHLSHSRYVPEETMTHLNHQWPGISCTWSYAQFRSHFAVAPCLGRP
jgi:hypothetical protein